MKHILYFTKANADEKFTQKKKRKANREKGKWKYTCEEKKRSEWWIHSCDDGSFFDILKSCENEKKMKEEKIPIKI